MPTQGEQVYDREEWDEIEDFPNYMVSTLGNIYNMKVKELRHIFQNQRGFGAVTLFRDGRPYTRSVSVLVANSFVPRPKVRFDTPIHLDGDRMNANANNLVWRSRAFAIRYYKQFNEELFLTHERSVVNLSTGERFDRLQEAVLKYGLIFNTTFIATCNGEEAWPTEHKYVWVD